MVCCWIAGNLNGLRNFTLLFADTWLVVDWRGISVLIFSWNSKSVSLDLKLISFYLWGLTITVMGRICPKFFSVFPKISSFSKTGKVAPSDGTLFSSLGAKNYWIYVIFQYLIDFSLIFLWNVNLPAWKFPSFGMRMTSFVWFMKKKQKFFLIQKKNY